MIHLVCMQKEDIYIYILTSDFDILTNDIDILTNDTDILTNGIDILTNDPNRFCYQTVSNHS